MNMKKFKDFTKKYGFYLAVGAVSIGAITAVFLTTGKDSQLVNEKDPYEQAQDVSGTDVTVVPGTEGETQVDVVSGEVVEVTTPEEGKTEEVANTTDAVMPEGTKEVSDETEELTSETFSTTTAEEEKTPFFADGDTLGWPVGGEVVVPYRDDTTKHWFSTALQQTMRTYGVCISAKEGESIKAPAKGTIIDIIDDSTGYESTKLVGNVGQVVVMDLGNGYTAEIGLQGGKANKDLIGQVVDASQVIGTVGTGTGPFADLSYNVYMQVKHDDAVIDPTTMLSFHEDVAGVDMGHVQE